MKIQCSKCKSNYNINDEKIPTAGAKIKCPKCQNIIQLAKPPSNPVAPVPQSPPKNIPKIDQIESNINKKFKWKLPKSWAIASAIVVGIAVLSFAVGIPMMNTDLSRREAAEKIEDKLTEINAYKYTEINFSSWYVPVKGQWQELRTLYINDRLPRDMDKSEVLLNLQQAGYLKIVNNGEEGGTGPRVIFNEKMEQHISEDNEYGLKIKTAVRDRVKVTGISKISDKNRKVEYTITFESNTIGNYFYGNKNKAFVKKSCVFALYDDGWRVEKM